MVEGYPIDEMLRDIKSIAGRGEDSKTSGSEESSKSVVSQFREASKENTGEKKEIYNQELEKLGEVKSALQKEERALKKEVAEKESVPNHTKLNEIYNRSTKLEMLELDYKIVERAFEDTQNTVQENGEQFLVLDKIQDAGDAEALISGDWGADGGMRSTPGKPQIKFIEIQREMTWREKLDPFLGIAPPDIRTGEVLVVISLNNGTTEDENTVITVTAKHEGGKLLLQRDKQVMFRVYSEADYKNAVRGEDESVVDADVLTARGKITMDGYVKKYRDENGNDLKTHWEKWDAKLKETPDALDVRGRVEMQRREAVLKSRKELLDGLEGKYSERLQALQKKTSEIIKLVEMKVSEIANKNREVLTNGNFLKLIALIESGAPPEAIGLLKNMLAESLGLSVAELDVFIAKRAVTPAAPTATPTGGTTARRI